MPVDPADLDLPRRPGVYLFRDARERVLYVGKATDLSSRVRSYWTANPDREMVPRLVQAAERVDCIVTHTPTEALVLERQLIRDHRPRFNSHLKDDKSYPFLALTDDEHPRIIYTRHPPKGVRRWGPFPDAWAAKQLMQVLRRAFGIRDCPQLLPQGCLSMHIGLCHGPCVGREGYDRQVEAAIRVLDGDGRSVLEGLLADMDQAAGALEFERAAQLRDLVASVQRTLSDQVVSSCFYQDTDAVGFAVRGDFASVVVIGATEGVVQGQDAYPMVHRGDSGETIGQLLVEHYEARRPPRRLLVPTPIDAAVREWLSERRGGPVEVRVPQRGDLAVLRRLADQNADVHVERISRKADGNLERRAVEDCQLLLGVDSLDLVVCFDMAQLQGHERVGASVVLREGRPDKGQYHHYRLRQDDPDDLGMMREAVDRWLRRQEAWPDLLLIDGGETHLSTIHALLVERGLDDRIPLGALAKREETLHRVGHAPIILDRRGRLLVHARDEAHRFVNRYHRKRRATGTLRDPLEAVPGLGAKRLQTLLRHFGGRRGIEGASQEQLGRVLGIGAALAERLWQHLHPPARPGK